MDKKTNVSLFKNVPLYLMDELMRYRTKGSAYDIRWRFRKPKEGIRYGRFGNLKRENATAATLHIVGVYTKDEVRELYIEMNDSKAKVVDARIARDEAKNHITAMNIENDVLRERVAELERERDNFKAAMEDLASTTAWANNSQNRWMDKYYKFKESHDRWLIRWAVSVYRWIDGVKEWWHDPFGDNIKQNQDRADASP